MFNSTFFGTASDEGSVFNSQMMLIFGAMATSMSGVVTNLFRSITGYIYEMLFSFIHLDEDKEDSPEFSVTEGLYKHILKNRTRFQGWNVRLARQVLFSEDGDVSKHEFVLPTGGVLFWNWGEGSWFPHLYYASYERAGKGWWQTSNMTLIFLRISCGDAIRILDRFSRKEVVLSNYIWGYTGHDDNPKWTPDKGRDRKIVKPVYIPTPDTEAVLKRVQLSIDSWKHENASVQAFNAGRYLLHGPHGTYKTTLVRHIAHLYRMNIYIVTQEELGTKSLRKMVASLPERSILLFDDIDLSILDPPKETSDIVEIDQDGRRSRGRGRDLTPVLKSVFGGTTKFPPGCLIFITTNSKKIPKAITSRFLQFYLGYAPSEWNRKIFLHMCPNAEEQAKDFMRRMGDRKISQRKITESLAVSYASSEGDPRKILEQTLKLLVVPDEPKVEIPPPPPTPPPEEETLQWDCFTGL